MNILRFIRFLSVILVIISLINVEPLNDGNDLEVGLTLRQKKNNRKFEG